MMRRRLAIGVLAVSWSVSAQHIDLSSLDKLASRAKSANRVSLDRDQVVGALSMLSGSDLESKKNLDGLKRLAQNLSGVEVRSFEFEKKGQYSDSDLACIRAQLAKLKNWSKIIDSKEDGEHSEIFMSSVEGHRGLAIIAAEETEVSIVILKGVASLKEMGNLGGIMGLPHMSLGPVKKNE